MLVGASVGCGGQVAFPTQQESCEDGGGEWSVADCGGGGDRCGLGACESVVGDGCVCDTPGECWDGERCVYDPGLILEICLAEELFLYPSCADGSYEAGGCCAPDAGEACWDGERCIPWVMPEG
jgi:hypothetical protein